jgi:outer membrane protein TolC
VATNDEDAIVQALKRIGILAALLGAGCASGPVRPFPEGLEIPEKAETPARSDPHPLPATPLSLGQAVALAFERNPDLRVAAERVAVAQAHVEEAMAMFYPRVGARLSYGRTDDPAQAFGMIVSQRRFAPSLDINSPGATQNWRPEIVATLSLFRGFRDSNALEASRKAAEIAALERSAIRNALAQAVTDTFFVHLAARQEAQAAAASVKAVESELVEARKRFEAGALLKSDVLSLEVRLASSRDTQVRSTIAVEHVRTCLRVLLGLGTGESAELSTDVPPEERSLPRDPKEAMERAAASRPEPEAAARLVALRTNEKSAEQGAWFPSVDVFASYGLDAPDLAFSSKQDNWAFGFSVDVPIFDGFRTRARVAAAERHIEEARAIEVKVRLAIEQEVRTAILHRDEALDRVSVAETAVPAAEEALRLVREQYQAGTVTVTRYLEAEAALAEARSRHIAARTDVRRAGAELRKAIGDWK